MMKLRVLAAERMAERTHAAGESVTIVTPRAALSTAALSTTHTDALYAAALASMGITGLPSFVAEVALLENALERVLPHWHLLDTTLYAWRRVARRSMWRRVTRRNRRVIEPALVTFPQRTAEHDQCGGVL